MEDEAGDVFEINLEIFDEPMAAFLVARRVNERVEDASDLSEVDRGALDQGEDETGEEVDAAGISVKKGFQGLLELGMLVRRASILSDREAPIVSGGMLDGHPRLISGTMRNPYLLEGNATLTYLRLMEPIRAGDGVKPANWSHSFRLRCAPT